MEFLTRKKFSFTSSSLPADTFSVVQFEGDEGLSQLYCFEILLLSGRLDLDLQDLLNQPATFTIHREGGEAVDYHGMLCDVEQLNEFDGAGFYRVRLVPRLWWLSISRHQQVFLDQTLKTMLPQVLTDGGLTAQDFEFKWTDDYPVEAFVCQYRESHFQFLSRWLERTGAYFFFRQGPQGERIVFTDALIAHEDLPAARRLAYSPASGMDAAHLEESIRTFSCRSRVVPSRVLLKDYNYEKPSLAMEGKAEVDPQGRGQVYLYGEHFQTLKEGNRLARVRKEELLCRRNEYRGTSSVPFLLPGFLFELTRHFRADRNRKYLITEVHHEGSQAGYLTAGLQQALAGVPIEVFYRNEFGAIPDDVQFRPRRETEQPRISGTLSATIDAAGDGTYAELDEQGRYKVILPFDLSGRKDAKASTFLRMAQPYAGSDHGMHFPLHKGTEVLLSFLDGDPDRPVIAGAVPNTATPSPVTSAAAASTQLRLVSSRHNELQMEDLIGSERILMNVPRQASYFRLGASVDAAAAADPAGAPALETSGTTGIRIHTHHQLWIEGNIPAAGEEATAAYALYSGGAPAGDDLPECFAGTGEGLFKTLHSHPYKSVLAAKGQVAFTLGDSLSCRCGTSYVFSEGALYEELHAPEGSGESEGAGHDLLDKAGPDWETLSDSDDSASAEGYEKAQVLARKRYGNLYEFIDGKTIRVNCGGVHAIQVGGRLVETRYDGGKKISHKWEEEGVGESFTYDGVTGSLTSYTYCNADHFTYKATIPNFPKLDISTLASTLLETAISIKANNKIDISLGVSASMEIDLSAGLDMEIKGKTARIEFDATSGHLEYHGPGSKVDKEAALKLAMEDLLLKNTEVYIESCGMRVSQTQVELLTLNMSVRSGFHLFM